MRHPIETLWREVGLPEYFLGNDGSNTKLYALYDAILARSSEQADEATSYHKFWIEERDKRIAAEAVAKLNTEARLRTETRLAEAMKFIEAGDEIYSAFNHVPPAELTRGQFQAMFEYAEASNVFRAPVSSPVTEKTDG